jgi:hypothetical protein
LPSTHLSEDEEKAYNHIWERKETKGMDQRFLGATSRERHKAFLLALQDALQAIILSR